ncbi:uncharacterized protein LOC129957355 [Argiope bruennichi]|uniref:uncharacterized protein LOC129957355 n=1 Tax=Argiope bruennichi TaxID=94029 RepID=UPI002493EEDF|nr:uncharacterized protein LOC129957355 [Argiope bruennichi]
MASRKINILEQSTREHSLPSTVNRASVRVNAATRCSTPTQDRNLDASSKLLIRSYPEYSAIGVTVPANGQSLDPEETEQSVDEVASTGCGAFWKWYTKTAISFRNSSYIHILQFVFSYMPVSAIIMGLIFNNECPQVSFLPLLVTVLGIVGIVCIGLWIAHSYCEHCGTACSTFLKCSISVSFVLLVSMVAMETYIIGCISPSFDTSAQEYCSKTFYFYVIYKEVVSAGALILVALLYFPGSGLHTCCRDCSAPSPASAFFPGP